MNELNFKNGFNINEVIGILTHNIVQFCIHLLVAVVVFYVGKFVIHKVYNLVKRILQRRETDASIASFLLSGVQIVLYFVLIIAVVGIMGIETSSFVALFASAGVAIGMALSGTLQNFAGGVLILLLKPYKVGEYIEAQGYAGTVKEIQLFSTFITTPDNKTIIIPNGPLFTGSINNYSRQPIRRLEWTIGVAYGCDYPIVRQALLDILLDEPRLMHNDPAHPIDIYLGALADSSVNFTVRAWVSSADYWPTYYAINERIYTEFNRLNIPFPFPQLDVHLQ